MKNLKKIINGLVLVSFLMLSACGGSNNNSNKDQFKTIKIGNQEWMIENLNVNTFRNGDVIYEAKTHEEWINAGKEGKPAWCYYDNDTSNGGKYGKLYNWYAVNDSRGLAPKGLKIPSVNECQKLIDFLSQNGILVEDEKYLGITGGARLLSDVDFFGCGDDGFWWSSTEFDAKNAWYRYFGRQYGMIYLNKDDKGEGKAVRCLRD